MMVLVSTFVQRVALGPTLEGKQKNNDIQTTQYEWIFFPMINNHDTSKHFKRNTMVRSTIRGTNNPVVVPSNLMKREVESKT